MTISKTFCIYPWMHQMIDTNGAVKLCCVAEDPTLPNRFGDVKSEGQAMHVDQTSLSNAWNSEYMISVRERMVTGKQVMDCGQCYRKEREGQSSFRLRANKDWKEKVKQVEQYYKIFNDEYNTADQPTKNRMDMSKHYVEDLPEYLDIRFGNLCNLKCRMCTGIYSKKLGEELKEISNKDPEFKKIAQSSAEIYNFDWYDNEDFWQELEKYLPHVRLLYLTGGEPTLVEGNYTFLRGLIDKGYAKNISLVFNTNVTNFQQRFLDTVNHFDRVTFNLSIDGVGGVQEYIRYPSKWKAVQQNMSKLMDKINATNQDKTLEYLLKYDPQFLDIQTANQLLNTQTSKDNNASGTQFRLVYTPTVNVINVGSFDELVNWAYQFSQDNKSNKVTWDMEPIMLQGPQFQDMAWANKEYKKYALQKLKNIEPKAFELFTSLHPFVNKMKIALSKIEDKLESKSNNEQLYKWNTEIDKHRGIDIKDYIEYSDMIYE